METSLTTKQMLRQPPYFYPFPPSAPNSNRTTPNKSYRFPLLMLRFAYPPTPSVLYHEPVLFLVNAFSLNVNPLYLVHFSCLVLHTTMNHEAEDVEMKVNTVLVDLFVLKCNPAVGCANGSVQVVLPGDAISESGKLMIF